MRQGVKGNMSREEKHGNICPNDGGAPTRAGHSRQSEIRLVFQKIMEPKQGEKAPARVLVKLQHA